MAKLYTRTVPASTSCTSTIPKKRLYSIERIPRKQEQEEEREPSKNKSILLLPRHTIRTEAVALIICKPSNSLLDRLKDRLRRATDRTAEVYGQVFVKRPLRNAVEEIALRRLVHVVTTGAREFALVDDDKLLRCPQALVLLLLLSAVVDGGAGRDGV